MDNQDRMLCHACGGVWLKHGSSLTCPHCESDFTEIVEIPPETPSSRPPGLEAEPQSPHVNPWADHNPWEREETGAPRTFGFMDSRSSRSAYAHHTYRSPDGRFTFSSTTIGGGLSPRQGPAHPNPMVPMMLQNLDTIFQGLSESYDPQRQRGAGEDPFHPHSPGWQEHDFPGIDEHAPREGVHPRNTNVPPPVEPAVGSLADLMEALRNDFGQRRRPGRYGARGVAGPNPFAMLSAILNMDRNGDAVYSQEELDRVISQLIGHNTTGTAPPPASTRAIHSLPKKKMDQQMMGSDGSAECSICMDAVELGTEVTVLPCTHWFHFNCIKAWLSQHNTCPHCRRSIDSAGAAAEGTSENPVVIHDSPENPSPSSSGHRRRRSSPFTSRSGRSSFSRSSPNSPSPDMNESGPRRPSRSEGQRGGITGWVWSRLGGGSG
ncbi:uncharacterized protein N7459_004213 [Penicillium hispanicum]|uniref:uncharacterized protein n=1 Tax=Penicillium hispanicum TaxID=1080232 RepID=UPI0025411395|nr:uncharacterized protein N7459_004213 [Penicillium hispanicum]KAJ5584413.1 hypothetical protein N7459_004213 [Penicillium hispanicum]